MSDLNNDEVIVIHPPLPEAPDRSWPNSSETSTVVLSDATVVEQPSIQSPVGVRSDATRGERALGLDIFRGLMMVAMVLSFTILGKAGLPDWMYHMQFPPPLEQHTPIAGLTWRDLIFPGFIFALAAAIPLANTKLLTQDEPYPLLIWRSARRAALLFAFALLIGHTNPFWTNDYTKVGNATALAGFAACWALLLARRPNWDERKFKLFRTAGLVAAALLVVTAPLLYDASFSLYRKDNVIHALAFIGLACVPIWLFTRTSLPLRIAIVAALVALKLAATAPGWVHNMWQQSSWLVEPWFVELLILAVPGTIAGERILDWMRTARLEEPGCWPKSRLTALAITCSLVTPVLLIGLYGRFIPQTTVAILAVVAGGFAFTHRPVAARDRILADLFRWGAVFLVIGILLEPFEGGIRKDPQTLSFLLLMAGFSFHSLVAVMIASDLSQRGRKVLHPFALLGRNPLMIYVMFSLCINHIAYLIGVGDLFTVGAVPALARAAFFTTLTAVAVIYLSRKGLLWKA